MSKFFANLLWVALALPFYVLILICCFYSCLLCLIFCNMTQIESYEWVDKMNTWMRNTKNVWLGKR